MNNFKTIMLVARKFIMLCVLGTFLTNVPVQPSAYTQEIPFNCPTGLLPCGWPVNSCAKEINPSSEWLESKEGMESVPGTRCGPGVVVTSCGGARRLFPCVVPYRALPPGLDIIKYDECIERFSRVESRTPVMNCFGMIKPQMNSDEATRVEELQKLRECVLSGRGETPASPEAWCEFNAGQTYSEQWIPDPIR